MKIPVAKGLFLEDPYTFPPSIFTRGCKDCVSPAWFMIKILLLIPTGSTSIFLFLLTGRASKTMCQALSCIIVTYHEREKHVYQVFTGGSTTSTYMFTSVSQFLFHLTSVLGWSRFHRASPSAIKAKQENVFCSM